MSKTKKIISVIVISVILLILLCSTFTFAIMYFSDREDYSYKDSAQYSYDIENSSDFSTVPSYSEEMPLLSQENYDSTSGAIVEKSMIIKDGSIELLVDDLDSAISEIKDVINSNDGTLVSMNDRGKDSDRLVTITFRIPSEDFEKIVEIIKEKGDEVMNVSISADDITQEYTDLQARLTNLQATEAQLRDIMTRATTITDTLAVQRELTTVRGEIEVLQGQILYYERHTSESTIRVVMSQNPENLPITEEKWRPLEPFKDAFSTFISVMKGLYSLLVWLLVFSPCIIIPLVITLIIRKRKKNGK